MARVISNFNINGQEFQLRDSEGTTLAQIANGTYAGVNLSEKFSGEIDGSPWTWIKNRIQDGDFAGIYVGDYIPFTADGNSYQAQIAGINTYTGYGDNYAAVGNHIDFITKEVWPTGHVINQVRYNNGTSAEDSPWLASDMYHWLNSKSGTVPNGTTYGGGSGQSVNYTSSGVYYYLPTALKNVIAEKTLAIETRYTTATQSVLTESNGFKWANIGKLWLPTELEVTGTLGRGTKTFSTMGSIQYPLFANTYVNRRKVLANTSDTRASWWTMTPSGEGTGVWCYMHISGYAQHYYTDHTSYRVPICFRIA